MRGCKPALSDTSDTALLGHLADAAGWAILPYFRTPISVEDKGMAIFDPVTEADRAAEAAMRELIERERPDDGILGEEFGMVRGEAERVWVLDPIDGTRSFIAGAPVWGVLIGLVTAGRPTLGMMAQPFIGERFRGDGRHAWYSGPRGAGPLATRRCPRLADAILSTTSPKLFEAGEQVTYERIEKKTRLARYGLDCYAYAMLAAGFVDLVIESGLKPYDIAALVPIIEGAGGRVSTWEGGPAGSGGQIVAAGDPTLHDEVLRLLAE